MVTERLTDKEIDVLLHNLSIGDVLHNALINALGEVLLRTDEEKPNVLTFDVPILPDDVESIFHQYWLETFPFIADRFKYKIEKKNTNTIVVEYFLNLNDADIRKIINSYLNHKYEWWDEDDLGFTYYKCDEKESANISSDIYRFLALFGICKEQIGLDIHIQFGVDLSDRCVLCGKPILISEWKSLLADGYCCSKCHREKVILAQKAKNK